MKTRKQYTMSTLILSMLVLVFTKDQSIPVNHCVISSKSQVIRVKDSSEYEENQSLGCWTELYLLEWMFVLDPPWLGSARPIDGRPYDHVNINDEELQVFDTFCYLGDMLSGGGGCESTINPRAWTAWGKFRELLPILTCKSLSLKTRGMVYTMYVRAT